MRTVNEILDDLITLNSKPPRKWTEHDYDHHLQLIDEIEGHKVAGIKICHTSHSCAYSALGVKRSVYKKYLVKCTCPGKCKQTSNQDIRNLRKDIARPCTHYSTLNPAAK